MILKRGDMCAKQWKAEKQFVLDCPVCREPALPAQKADGIGGVAGGRLIHPGRIASCFVEGNSRAAETIRTDFNGKFGSAYTNATIQTRTDEISSLTEWSKTFTGHITADEWERWRDLCYRHAYPEIDVWENEGGTYLVSNPD